MCYFQSGCCKPPTYCGFEYKNATFWEVPKSGPAVPDSDCTTWNNDQAKLCYDCKSCKGGVLANIKKEWRHLVIFNSCLFVVITILYSLGYCAYKNNKSDNKYTRYRAYSWACPPNLFIVLNVFSRLDNYIFFRYCVLWIYWFIFYIQTLI